MRSPAKNQVKGACVTIVGKGPSSALRHGIPLVASTQKAPRCFPLAETASYNAECRLASGTREHICCAVCALCLAASIEQHPSRNCPPAGTLPPFGIAQAVPLQTRMRRELCSFVVASPLPVSSAFASACPQFCFWGPGRRRIPRRSEHARRLRRGPGGNSRRRCPRARLVRGRRSNREPRSQGTAGWISRCPARRPSPVWWGLVASRREIASRERVVSARTKSIIALSCKTRSIARSDARAVSVPACLLSSMGLAA